MPCQLFLNYSSKVFKIFQVNWLGGAVHGVVRGAYIIAHKVIQNCKYIWIFGPIVSSKRLKILKKVTILWLINN